MRIAGSQWPSWRRCLRLTGPSDWEYAKGESGPREMQPSGYLQDGVLDVNSALPERLCSGQRNQATHRAVTRKGSWFRAHLRYTGPLIEPLVRANLTSSLWTVKDFGG